MSPKDQEEAYVELKRSILVTSAYDQETKYQQIYGRMKALIRTILKRHAHFVLDPIASGALSRLSFTSTNLGAQYPGDRGSAHLYLPVGAEKSMSNEAVLAAAMLLWHGNYFTNELGEMYTDPKSAKRLVNYLVEVRDYAPALLLKGMMAKYGDEVYTEVRLQEAKETLSAAKARGVGSAGLELEGIAAFAILEGIKSVHLQ